MKKNSKTLYQDLKEMEDRGVLLKGKLLRILFCKKVVISKILNERNKNK